MSKLPSNVQSPHSDFEEAIKNAEARAGTSQGMPEVYRTLEAFLDAWKSDPQRKAELNRRARFVKEHTRPDTPYDKANAQAKKAASLHINTLEKRRSFFSTPTAMMAWSVLRPKVDASHHLAEALGQERADLQRLLRESTLPALIKKKLARWDKKARAVESEARQLRADGCRYLTHPRSLQRAVKLGEISGAIESVKEGSAAVTRGLLKLISQAVESLVAWFEETEASEDHPKGSDDDKAVKLEAEPQDGGPWSTADSPTRWAKQFKISPKTFKRRVKDGKIRAKILSDRLYQVHLDDLPKQDKANESGHK